MFIKTDTNFDGSFDGDSVYPELSRGQLSRSGFCGESKLVCGKRRRTATLSIIHHRTGTVGDRARPFEVNRLDPLPSLLKMVLSHTMRVVNYGTLVETRRLVPIPLLADINEIEWNALGPLRV